MNDRIELAAIVSARRDRIGARKLTTREQIAQLCLGRFGEHVADARAEHLRQLDPDDLVDIRARKDDREVMFGKREQRSVFLDVPAPRRRHRRSIPVFSRARQRNTRRVSRYAATVAEAHTFGRYRVTKSLGSGAMGDVFEAIDDVLGREVAIKTLRTDSGAHSPRRTLPQRGARDRELSHPNIVHIFDVDIAADAAVPRDGARRGTVAVSQTLPLPTEQLIPLGIQIARALAAAHAAGVFHRDVKPSNILGAGPGRGSSPISAWRTCRARR